MRPVSPLPSKVDHEFAEPAYSLLIRSLTHNGGRIGKTIDRIVGGREIVPSRWDPTEIARICKADAASVVYATPAVGSKTAAVLGQVLSAEHVGITTRRWCPACLAERPYHRVWWDVLPVTSCPEHGTKLTAACGCEGRSLRWRSGTLRHCSAGCSLEGIACNEAEPDVLAFDGYVVARLRGDHDGRLSEFDDVGLGELISICERLGKASFDEGRSIHVVRKSYDIGRLHAEGFRILIGLPETFDRLLERIREGAAARTRTKGLRRTYGNLHRFVRDLPEHGVGVALKNALVDNVRRNLTVRNGTMVDGRTPFVTDGIVLTVAAEAVGMRYERFADLIERLGIAREVRANTFEMSLANFEALKAKLEGAKTLRQVSLELGVTTTEVAGLVAAGILDSIASGQGLAGWIFPADAAAKLLGTLRAKAGNPGPCPFGFLSVPLAAGRSGVSVSEVLELAVRDVITLRPGRKRRRGILHYRVDPRELARHAPDDRQASVTVAVAARELGLRMPAMDAVIASSMLRTETFGGFVRVPVREIERFKDNWAPMSELRAAMGVTTWLPVATVLAEAGVFPAISVFRLWDRIYPRDPALRVCAAAAASYVEAPRIELDRDTLSDTLGIPGTMVRQMVDAGLIRLKPGCRAGSVSEDELERLRTEYVTLGELSKAFGYSGARAVLSVLDKLKVIAACRRPTFYSYLFRRIDAFDALRRQAIVSKVGVPAVGVPTLKVKEVASRIGTGHHMTLQMISGGILASERRGNLIRVPVVEVERFLKEYVLANEVARLAGRKQVRGTGAAVTKVLLRNGLSPVCAKPDFINFVFRRDEALAIMQKLGWR